MSKSSQHPYPQDFIDMHQCVEISNLVNCTLRRLTSFSGTLLHDTVDTEANVCANACVDVFYVCTYMRSSKCKTYGHTSRLVQV